MLDDAINERIAYEKTLTAYVNELINRSDKAKIQEFADFRKFSIDTVSKCRIFYIGDMAEMLLPNYIEKVNDLGVISETNYKPIFKNRWIIPVFEQNGLVENLVGYSPFADERYIYGTSRYYRRRETLYGLENLHIAYKLGYAFLTEGITDTIRLRDMGYLNSFAMCGTHKSDYIMRILNRCKHGIIRIPDRDKAGLAALRQWECKRSVTLMVNIKYKDIDEMCRDSDDNILWVKEYIEDCVNWIKSSTHNNQNCLSETVTIL